MKKRIQIIVSLLLTAVLLLHTAGSLGEDTADFLLSAYPRPEMGDEWVVIALSGGSAALPDGWISGYYESVCRAAEASGGILDKRKPTVYSRVILALTAAGYDASAVAGYNLTAAITDDDFVKKQGINGPVFAVIALCGGGYALPSCNAEEAQPVIDLYADYILLKQLADGGFAFAGDRADPDITAMALQALAFLRDREDVEEAVSKALLCLQGLQKEDGGFVSSGAENAESLSQVIIALSALKIDPTDGRFVKNGRTLPDVLDDYLLPDGSYSHLPGGEYSALATVQACMARTAAREWQRGGIYGRRDTDEE